MKRKFVKVQYDRQVIHIQMLLALCSSLSFNLDIFNMLFCYFYTSRLCSKLIFSPFLP